MMTPLSRTSDRRPQTNSCCISIDMIAYFIAKFRSKLSSINAVHDMVSLSLCRTCRAANVECNATASFAIAHHFLHRMVTNKQKGCIVFTSSVAGFIPTPFAASYAATKAFVSQLACSLHIEVQSKGIDVCAVHPSPVASNFYEKVRRDIDYRSFYFFRNNLVKVGLTLTPAILAPLKWKGGSQDRADGAGPKERRGAGIPPERDPAERGVLRAEGPGSHGVGHEDGYLLRSVQLLHGAVHGGVALPERLQGTRQEQKVQEFVRSGCERVFDSIWRAVVQRMCT